MSKDFIVGALAFTLSMMALAYTSGAHAATTQKMYLDAGGRQVDAQTAIVKAAQGELTYMCQPQEFKVSKSGNSISIRNKKKKLTTEEIQQQIDDLKKRAE